MEKDFWVVERSCSKAVRACLRHTVSSAGSRRTWAFSSHAKAMGLGAREKRVLRPICEWVAVDLGLSDQKVSMLGYKEGFTRNGQRGRPRRVPIRGAASGAARVRVLCP